MKIIALVGLCLLLCVPVSAQDDSSSDNVPYIYYYSNVLKGIVVERADGTDSRVLGRGIVDEDVHWSLGPGWSPDGRWFAWRVETAGGYRASIGKAYVVGFESQQTVNVLQEFSCVHNLLWHPTESILLIRGVILPASAKNCPSDPYPITTYWLLDVENQIVLSSFSTEESSWRRRDAPVDIFWLDGAMSFRQYTRGTDERGFQDYRISMYFDGRVMMQPFSREEIDAQFEDLTPYQLSFQNRFYHEFTSWFEQPDARVDGVPPAIDFDGYTVSGHWHGSEEWILVGHEYCRADCSGVTEEVSIFNPKSGAHREISDCGAYPACVGWLPEHVDVDALPHGKIISVLPEPVSIIYNDEPTYTTHFGQTITHEITCNQETRQQELMTNIESGLIDFVLPMPEPCGSPIQREPELVYATEPIIFAVSPDGAYYAMTDATKYTSLYEAATGERITTLNFYGAELAFSDDSAYLTTMTRTATATWDIQALIANRAD